LQIQVNYDPEIRSLRDSAPDTVSGPALVSRTEPIKPEEIRKIFQETIDFERKKKKKNKNKKKESD
jgi:hypothetical protein